MQHCRGRTQGAEGAEDHTGAGPDKDVMRGRGQQPGRQKTRHKYTRTKGPDIPLSTPSTHHQLSVTLIT